ncbi:MAG: ABC transporter permease [Gammaproteobacteria bacterium]|nr:ABC transporter permease [Gammaproteobacteria bacterium]
MSDYATKPGPAFEPATDSSSSSEAPPSRARIVLRRMWQLRMGVFGLILMLTLIFVAVFAPYVATHDPLEQDILSRLTPPSFLEGGDPSYLLGTDQLGRDLFSRIIYGARISLMVGLCAVAVSMVIGVLMGLAAGYFGGKVDAIVDFLVNAMLAFPFILLAMTLVIVLGASMENIILALGISNWPIFARVTRIETKKLREQEFVLAAVAQGLSHSRIVLKHILSNLAAPILVIATVEIARAIIRETFLSFLGLGIQPPTPSWGLMLAEGRDYMLTLWWLSTLPGLAIFLAALGINLVGDALRDLFDPRMRKG